MTLHAWNKERTQIAISSNNKVHIKQKKRNKWRTRYTLDQHDMRVTGIDWAPNTNRIVTCSADRNAYVWIQGNDTKWTYTLVILRIKRSATCAKWSPEENKFAVGSGNRMISICYFEPENNCWVSRHIRKPIRSTVTCLDWHHNNILLAAGSTDFTVRVFSAYIEDIEGQPGPDVWGTTFPLGQLLAEFPNSPYGGGWVHSVSFSADGNKIAWVAHDSSINVGDATQGKAVIKLKTKHPPFLVCTWLNSNYLAVAGHDCKPFFYCYNGSNLALFAQEKNTMMESRRQTAMEKFQTLDSQARLDTSDAILDSTHQKTITSMTLYNGSKVTATKIVCLDFDDHLVMFWPETFIDAS